MTKIISTVAGDFDLNSYKKLKRLYTKAVLDNDKSFYFSFGYNGRSTTLETNFAKYLIEFLSLHFES